MYDLIIKNGTIVDGSGDAAYISDIAVRDGKIVRIQPELSVNAGAAEMIDASGLTVTPGFIDSHSHSDSAIFSNPDQLEKIEQGITLSVGGQCGGSPAPYRIAGSRENIYTMGSFLEAAAQVPQGANIAVFVGHGSLRRTVMGTENRAPTAEELEQMKELLRDGIEHGAMGISFGLIYTPGCYAQTDELIELAKVAGEYHALAAAHIRDEGDELIEAVEEFLQILRASGARGVLSHHKAAWEANWGKVKQTLAMIDAANAEGMDVYCDVYPYTASHTGLAARFIPKEYHAKGTAGLIGYLSDPSARAELKKINKEKFGTDLSWVLVASCKNHPEYEGLRIPQIAALRGTDDYDAVFDLIRDSGNVCQACYFTMCEEDVETVLAYPRSMICTDSGVAGGRTVFHPRLKASFPRALGQYVRQRRVTSLEEMIRKMTSLPAQVYSFTGKGLIREGYDADICIFDADRIIDRSEYDNCCVKAEGLRYVLLGGEVVVEDAVHNGKRLGKVMLAEHHR